MKAEIFVNLTGADFYTGVPDSQLKALCACLLDIYGTDPEHHIIAANEGNSTALAAGYHLATGKVPVVYMQNSGEGNVINPVASLLNDRVYAIPVIFVIGWRGEPGVKDEPQHIFQGEITLALLEQMEIDYFVLEPDTTDAAAAEAMERFRKLLEKGKSVAFVVKKGALEYEKKISFRNPYRMNREEVIRHIVEASGEAPIISTTGKISRELFEIREEKKQEHMFDFLTVGSMGHASSIALAVACQKPGKKVWCIDGDGAVLMHMGAMAVIGNQAPANLVHIVINNEAHETVGGMPTAAATLNFVEAAEAAGYKYAVCVCDYESLDRELRTAAEENRLTLIEVKCAIGSRADLGRPTTTARENKESFMNYLK